MTKIEQDNINKRIANFNKIGESYNKNIIKNHTYNKTLYALQADKLPEENNITLPFEKEIPPKILASKSAMEAFYKESVNNELADLIIHNIVELCSYDSREDFPNVNLTTYGKMLISPYIPTRMLLSGYLTNISSKNKELAIEVNSDIHKHIYSNNECILLSKDVLGCSILKPLIMLKEGIYYLQWSILLHHASFEYYSDVANPYMTKEELISEGPLDDLGIIATLSPFSFDPVDMEFTDDYVSDLRYTLDVYDSVSWSYALLEIREAIALNVLHPCLFDIIDKLELDLDTCSVEEFMVKLKDVVNHGYPTYPDRDYFDEKDKMKAWGEGLDDECNNAHLIYEGEKNSPPQDFY